MRNVKGGRAVHNVSATAPQSCCSNCQSACIVIAGMINKLWHLTHLSAQLALAWFAVRPVTAAYNIVQHAELWHQGL